ncbi:MAG: 30S ribosomal protein S5 [Patescibacteria group bacterium]|jgi:small subunit ribosomal protein S5
MARRGDNKGGDRRHQKKDDDFEQKLIDIARVTRVMAGGKRMSFRACVVVGDKKGQVGMGLRKGADVSMAINKAVRSAKKNLVKVNIVNDSLPCTIRYKYGAAKILLKPAPSGTGVIAGGPLRAVMELAGIKNVVSKIMGTKNKINNVKAAILALGEMKTVDQIKKLRQ